MKVKPHSRFIIHIGINYFTVPPPAITNQAFLAFQQAVLTNGLEFSKVENQKNSIVLVRESPAPLQITVNALEPPVGQILVVAPQPKGSLELFIQEVEAAVRAYESVWSAQNRQIIKADATIRELYETTSRHAFQELWEERLGQPADALSAFGRPIRGGGLRFVMDPIQEDLPVQIEVKIESFLRDTSKIFVETQFTWPVPTKPAVSFEISERLTRMNSYVETQVKNFLSGGQT